MQDRYRISWIKNLVTAALIVSLLIGIVGVPMLLGDLLRDIATTPDAGLRLDAKANLIGAVLGAVIAGAIGAAAALIGIESERAHRRQEERVRKLSVARPALNWIERQKRLIDNFVTAIERWMAYPANDVSLARIDHYIDRLIGDVLASRIRDVVETEFLNVVEIFKDIDNARHHISRSGRPGFTRCMQTFEKARDKRAAAEALTEPLMRLQLLTEALVTAHETLENVFMSFELWALRERIQKLVIKIHDRRFEWEEEQRKQVGEPPTSGDR